MKNIFKQRISFATKATRQSQTTGNRRFRHLSKGCSQSKTSSNPIHPSIKTFPISSPQLFSSRPPRIPRPNVNGLFKKEMFSTPMPSFRSYHQTSTNIPPSLSHNYFVLYDGSCRICSTEVRFLSKRMPQSNPVRFIDIIQVQKNGWAKSSYAAPEAQLIQNHFELPATNPFDEASDYQFLMRRMHAVRIENGVSRLDEPLTAFSELYRRASLSWVLWITKYEWGKTLFNRFYTWFAGNRYTISAMIPFLKPDSAQLESHTVNGNSDASSTDLNCESGACPLPSQKYFGGENKKM